MRDWWLRRLVLAHLLSAVGEWAVTVGLLVHAFAWGGAAAVGALSIAVLLSPLVCTPLVASALARWRPHVVRVAGFGVEALAYVGATISAVLEAPSPVVAAFVVIGLAGATSIPPTSAALMPLIARSTDDLISANLWVGHCDSASALVGSLAAALVVGAGGPEAVFALCALAAALALGATVWRPDPLVRTGRPARFGERDRPIRRVLTELRARPWSRGVLAVSSARNALVGAFDVLLVVLALEVLDLGDGGPGYLSALVGAGALCSTFLVTVVVRRARLRGALMVAIALAATLTVLLGAWTEIPVAVVALPLIGLAMASMDALSRVLLQRSSDPRQLGPLFAALGLVAGLGQLAGSAVAQAAMALGGPRASLVTLGGVLGVLATLSVRSLRRADANTEVPVMEMTLLSGLPVFSSLPTVGLEQVARLAVHERVEPGTSIMTQGEPGLHCVVIVDGNFEVTAKGARQRMASRGDCLGELALLTNIPRTATGTARTAGEVLRIGRDPFLVALTGYDVGASVDDPDNATTLGRYREMVAAYDRHPDAGSADRAESWLGLGAAGRLLGDPSFTEPLRRGAGLAEAASDELLIAHAAAMTTWPGAFFFIAENPDHETIELCEDALTRLGADDPMRVRVLAALASQATFAYHADHRAALIREALELAERHGDPALTGAVLNSEFVCLWEPATLERRRQIAAALTEIAVRTGDVEMEFLGGFFTAYCVAESGQLGEARDQLVSLRPVLRRARIEFFEFLAERLIISIDIARGEPDVKDRIDALAQRHAHTHADTDGTWALQIGALAYQDGTLGSMRWTIAAMTDGPHARTWHAALALAELMDGDPEAAARTLDAQGDVPRNYFWLTVVQAQAEVAAALGLTDRCRALFDQLAPYEGRIGITASGSACFGLVSRSLGELALALGRHDEAVGLLTAAASEAARIGMSFEAATAHRLLSRAYDARATTTPIDGPEHDAAETTSSNRNMG